MPAPTLKELLAVAGQFDTLSMQHRQMMMLGQPVKVTLPDPDEEVSLEIEDEDPFNGNVNNRKVAERIARENKKIYANSARIIHFGDPTKAARDVERSLAVNPDAPEPDTDDELSVSPPQPTPGSPAARRIATPAKGATNPPTWKPNA